MNTKPIPAIIMLTAGLVTCIVGIVQHFSFGTYVKTFASGSDRILSVGMYCKACARQRIPCDG